MLVAIMVRYTKLLGLKGKVILGAAGNRGSQKAHLQSWAQSAHRDIQGCYVLNIWKRGWKNGEKVGIMYWWV